MKVWSKYKLIRIFTTRIKRMEKSSRAYTSTLCTKTLLQRIYAKYITRTYTRYTSTQYKNQSMEACHYYTFQYLQYKHIVILQYMSLSSKSLHMVLIHEWIYRWNKKLEKSSRVGTAREMTRRLEVSIWQGQLLKRRLFFKIDLICLSGILLAPNFGSNGENAYMKWYVQVQNVKNHKGICILKLGYYTLPTSQKLCSNNFIKEGAIQGKDQSNDQSKIQW